MDSRVLFCFFHYSIEHDWAMPLLSFICCLLVGDKQGALEFVKLIFRALCLCWDRQTQDLHIDWILFRGRSLIPVSCEVVNDHIDGYYPSSHYPIFAEFMLPRTVRLLEPPPPPIPPPAVQEDNWILNMYDFWHIKCNALCNCIELWFYASRFGLEH